MQQKAKGGRPRSIPVETLKDIVFYRADCRLGFAAIATRLNQSGTPTARDGKKWYPATVKAALRSRDLL